MPHFGLVLAMDAVEAARRAACRLPASKFVIAPTIRFEGQPGEQATMFLLDPAGNALEFKAMADPGEPVREELVRLARRASGAWRRTRMIRRGSESTASSFQPDG